MSSEVSKDSTVDRIVIGIATAVCIAAVVSIAVWTYPEHKQTYAERQPAGVWVEFEGKTYPVRIIGSIREWPPEEGETP